MDIAVSYDQTARRCDLVIAGRDFALDATTQSAMLVSLGSDRRAHGDDALPDGASDTDAARPLSLLSRRGWAGDALDVVGRRTGSRLWTLSREKQTETTRRRAEGIVNEAVGWLATERGQQLDITVRWLRAGVLAFRVRAGAHTVALQQAVQA